MSELFSLSEDDEEDEEEDDDDDEDEDDEDEELLDPDSSLSSDSSCPWLGLDPLVKYKLRWCPDTTKENDRLISAASSSSLKSNHIHKVTF